MQTDRPFWDSLVFDGIDEVNVEAVTAAFGTIEVVARGRAAGAECPDCGRFSDRVHDRYQRRLKDLPLVDQGFVIRLTVRRFVCGSADCQRRTFAEPFSRLAAPHARFTTRLNHALCLCPWLRVKGARVWCRGRPAGVARPWFRAERPGSRRPQTATESRSTTKTSVEPAGINGEGDWLP